MRSSQHRSTISDSPQKRQSTRTPEKLQFQSLVNTFVTKHGGQMTSTYQSNSPFIEESTLIKEILSTDIGRNAILCALKFSLTLVIPQNNTSLPTAEFITAHLLRRHTRSKVFMTLNGAVGILTNEQIRYQPVQHEPTQCKYMELEQFLSDVPNVTESSDDIIIEVVSGDVLRTPIGAVPILIVAEPFRWIGCSWGWLWDNVVGYSIEGVDTNTDNIKEYITNIFEEECATNEEEKPIEPIQQQTEVHSAIGDSPNEIENVNEKFDSISLMNDSTIDEIIDSFITTTTEINEQLFPKVTQEKQTFNTDEEVFKFVIHHSECPIEFLTSLTNYFNTFSHNCKSLDLQQRSKLLDNQIQYLLSLLPQELLNILSPQQRRMFSRHVYDILTTTLFPYLWPPLIQRNESLLLFECNSHDRTLSTILATHQFLAPHHFDISFFESDLGAFAIDVIVTEFRAIDSRRSPRSKALQITRTFKMISEIIYVITKTAVSADDLLPVSIYCLLRANPPHLASTMEYLTNFIPRWGSYSSEMMYYIAHFQSCVNVLRNLSLSSLTISDFDYSLFLYHTRKFQNPFFLKQSALLGKFSTWNISPFL
ncbi:Vacuolar sorting protein 9 (VPS9) domain containing protein [Entamoeba marina]